MDSFNIRDYVDRLGIALVREFEDAKLSTQSVAIGSNKESSVITKLQRIMPKGVGIGSGFVFDSKGNVSGQSDIIIYENELALKCAINDNDKDTYYNCESVIAVGEVKSTCTERELRDTFSKFNRVSSLVRYLADNQQSAFRPYLSKMALDGNFNNAPIERDVYHRIYKFLVCEKFAMSLQKTKEVYDEVIENDEAAFNIILDISGKEIVHYDNNGKLKLHPSDNLGKIDGGFSDFFYQLLTFINNGKSVPIDYGVYLQSKTGSHRIVESIGMDKI